MHFKLLRFFCSGQDIKADWYVFYPPSPLWLFSKSLHNSCFEIAPIQFFLSLVSCHLSLLSDLKMVIISCSSHWQQKWSQKLLHSDSTKHVAHQGEQSYLPGWQLHVRLTWSWQSRLFPFDISLISSCRDSQASKEHSTPSKLSNMAQTWWLQNTFYLLKCLD